MKTELLETLDHLITKAASDGKEEARAALLELKQRVHGMKNEAESEGEWYIVDRKHDNAVIRGPYKYSETAGAVRYELELQASDRQNEWWNLCCDYHEKP